MTGRRGRRDGTKGQTGRDGREKKDVGRKMTFTILYLVLSVEIFFDYR